MWRKNDKYDVCDQDDHSHHDDQSHHDDHLKADVGHGRQPGDNSPWQLLPLPGALCTLYCPCPRCTVCCTPHSPIQTALHTVPVHCAHRTVHCALCTVRVHGALHTTLSTVHRTVYCPSPLCTLHSVLHGPMAILAIFGHLWPYGHRTMCNNYGQVGYP